MTDIPSIVIAVLSSVGTLLLGIAGFIYTRTSDERKARSEAEKLISKYRDPLLLASHDLQSRLYSIVDLGVANWVVGGLEEKESLRLYTAFLVGQFLSWVYILRRQIQFLRFSTDKRERNQRLAHVLAEISDTFSTDDSEKGLSNSAFRLWRNQQLAIGELMTVSEGGEMYCMGNAAFCHKYKDEISYKDLQMELERGTDKYLLKRASHDPQDSVKANPDPSSHDNTTPMTTSQEFRNWFRPLITGTNRIASEKIWQFEAVADPLITRGRYSNEDLVDGKNIPDQRMRKLQHLLHDLMQILDLGQSGLEGTHTGHCHRARVCDCTKCKGTEACPCPLRNKSRCKWAAKAPPPEPQKPSFFSWQSVRKMWLKGTLSTSPA